MSLILEALRRSEAQRQLGRTPDVLTPMPVLRRTRATSNRHWWIALAVLALLVAGWIGWRELHPASRAATDASMMQSASNSAPRATNVSDADRASTAQSAATDIDIDASAINAASVSSIPSRASPPQSLPTQSHPFQAPPSQSSAMIASITAAKRAQTTTSTAPTATAAIVPTSGAKAPLTAAQVNASPLPSTIASLPNQSAVASLPSNMTPAEVDSLLPVNDLSVGERAALPALKVSMHVYAEVPADRFMIIDGTRVGEGGRIGSHIVLVKIRKDGGVLDIDGHRVLLPRP